MQLICRNKIYKVENPKQQHFLELYQPVHLPLSRFCRAIAGNVEDAEDLMNDTVLNAFESLDKLKNTEAFKSYIFSIASNLNKMRFRRKKFRAEFNEKEHQQIMDGSMNPEQATDFRLIYEKILELPDKSVIQGTRPVIATNTKSIVNVIT